MRITAALQPLARGLLDTVLPPACAICQASLPSGGQAVHGDVPRPSAGSDEAPRGTREIVCGLCSARLVPLPLPQCRRCGHPRLSAEAPLPAGVACTGAPDALPACRWCPRLPPFVRAVRSACRMDQGSGSAFVHALKYSGWRRVAEPMARHMARLSFPDDVVRERTALVPLPLSASRQRHRGYNQAEQLAVALSHHWRLPVWSDVVRRTRETKSQVQLTPSERAGNVSHAFAAIASARTRLDGSHVILVDDVITTAASLNAAAQALADGGTRIISYITFGRAPDPGDRIDSDLDFDQD